MKYEEFLSALERSFKGRPFTVTDAARVLAAAESGSHEVRDSPQRARDVGVEPRVTERLRQHAKSDLGRLHSWKLVRRTPLHTGKPGRQPFVYSTTRKGTRYLEWVRGPALLEAFEAFVTPGPVTEKVPVGDRLLRRLHAAASDSLDEAMLDLLELHLDVLLRRPSPQSYASLTQLFAGQCLAAISRASPEVMARGLRILGPFLRSEDAPPNASRQVTFRLPNVPVVDRDRRPALDPNGVPVTREVVVGLSIDELARAFRHGQTRFELDLTATTGSRVTLDLSSFASQLQGQSRPSAKPREPRDSQQISTEVET